MLDIVIPTYTPNASLENMAMECVKSYKGHGRIIVVEDGQEYSDKLRELADVYIYDKKNVGFTKNVNRGWRYATAEWVAIISSDTYLVSGDLKDLCIKGKVTSPVVVNQDIPGLTGSFFVVHKDCPKYLIETMRTFYSDTEYVERTKDIFQKVDSVKFYHHIAQSVSVSGRAWQDEDHDVIEYKKL